MRRYETIIILDPDLSEEQKQPFFDRLNELIPKEGGFFILMDDWKIKQLAYEIRKKARGHYIRLEYCGNGVLVNEIERFCRIDDRVLKFMTVLLEKDADIEQIKADMLAAAEEETRLEQERKATAEANAAAAAAESDNKAEEDEGLAMEDDTPENVKETEPAATKEVVDVASETTLTVDPEE